MTSLNDAFVQAIAAALSEPPTVNSAAAVLSLAQAMATLDSTGALAADVAGKPSQACAACGYPDASGVSIVWNVAEFAGLCHGDR